MAKVRMTNDARRAQMDAAVQKHLRKYGVEGLTRQVVADACECTIGNVSRVYGSVAEMTRANVQSGADDALVKKLHKQGYDFKGVKLSATHRALLK